MYFHYYLIMMKHKTHSAKWTSSLSPKRYVSHIQEIEKRHAKVFKVAEPNLNPIFNPKLSGATAK